MSYSFNYSRWNEENESYCNLTAEMIANDDELISRLDQFNSWYEDNRTKYKKDVLIDNFRETDEYNEFIDSFTPIYNIVHLLSSSNISKDNLVLLNLLVKNVVIIHIEELDANVIALTSYGTDLFDELELTYYVLDGRSPIKAEQTTSLSYGSEKLLEFCRKQTKKNNFVHNYEITTFVKSIL